MIVLFVILAIVSLWGVKFSNFHEDYISPSSSNAIKGIFAVIILFSHMRGYITLDSNFADSSYCAILNHIGQLMVAMYLFYSGYGIMESAQRKEEYFVSYPRKRVLKTLVHFDIAVLCYLLLDVVTGTRFSKTSYFTCWFGWSSIGNSNWFIFDILVLYIIVYIANIAARRINSNNVYSQSVALYSSVLSAFLWVALRILGKGSWWIDTLVAFPFGMWFSVFRERIEFFLRDRKKGRAAIVILIITFLTWHFTVGNDVYGICTCLFCLFIVALTTRVKMDNKILQWLGKHAFAIYIMQRLPMNLFRHLGWNENPYFFAAMSILAVLIVAGGFNKILTKIDKIIVKQYREDVS